MTTDNKKETLIGNLPAPDDKARGTIGAEELARILERARADTAGQVLTVGEEQRRHEEELAAQREAWAQWQLERRRVRALDADTAARRGAANAALARSACTTGGATLAGFLVAGPVGAVVGCAAGWLGIHLFGVR